MWRVPGGGGAGGGALRASAHGGWGSRLLERQIGAQIQGDVSIDGMTLSWTEQQRADSITISDDAGNLVLQGGMRMPSLLELADPEGRDQEYVFYAQLLKARIEADGSSNLGRTFGVTAEAGGAVAPALMRWAVDFFTSARFRHGRGGHDGASRARGSGDRRHGERARDRAPPGSRSADRAQRLRAEGPAGQGDGRGGRSPRSAELLRVLRPERRWRWDGAAPRGDRRGRPVELDPEDPRRAAARGGGRRSPRPAPRPRRLRPGRADGRPRCERDPRQRRIDQGALRGAARGSCRSCSSSSGRDRGAGGKLELDADIARRDGVGSLELVPPPEGGRARLELEAPGLLAPAVEAAAPAGARVTVLEEAGAAAPLTARLRSFALPLDLELIQLDARARRDGESAVDRLARSLRQGRGTLSLAGGGAVRLEVGPGETEDERLEARHALTSISFDGGSGTFQSRWRHLGPGLDERAATRFSTVQGALPASTASESGEPRTLRFDLHGVPLALLTQVFPLEERVSRLVGPRLKRLELEGLDAGVLIGRAPASTSVDVEPSRPRTTGWSGPSPRRASWCDSRSSACPSTRC